MFVFDFFQQNSDGINSLIATLGAIIGLYWWFCKRERKPKLELDVNLEHVKLGEKQYLVRLVILVKNYGQVLLETHEARVYLHQIKPIPIDKRTGKPFAFGLVPAKNEYDWPKIINSMEDQVPMDYTFEPGDSGPLIFERVISELPEVVSAYIYIRNDTTHGVIRDISARIRKVFGLKSDEVQLGWTTTKLFRIDDTNA